VYEESAITTIGYVLAALALALVLRKVSVRLQLSLAKHRSLAGHSRMARRFASWLPFYEYDESSFFGVDSAPPPVIAARRGGFMRLAALFDERFKNTVAQTTALAGSVPDLEFTSRYRVQRLCAPALDVGLVRSVLQRCDGHRS
jgi:glutamate-1-semialdehyde 2,1-aminomutase